MIYTGTFQDNRNHSYIVKIKTEGSDNKTLTFAANPVIIRQVSDGFFSPIKATSASITIVIEPEKVLKGKHKIGERDKTDPDYWSNYQIDPTDFYIQTNHGGKVEIYDENNDMIWEGYITPCTFNQPYIGYTTEYTIEAVSCISTLKNINYTLPATQDGSPIFKSFQDIIKDAFKKSGMNAYNKTTIPDIDNIDTALQVSEANFFDDDDERTPWTLYEVLEEICKYLCKTLVIDGATPKFIDYTDMAELDHNTITGPTEDNPEGDYLGTDSNISYDDCISKITVSQNAYKVDQIVTDLSDEDNIKWMDLGDGTIKWTKTKVRWFAEDITTTTAVQFSVFGTPKEETGWTTYQYTADCYPEDYLNTKLKKGCYIQKYASYKTDAATPASLGWNTVITFIRDRVNYATDDQFLALEYNSKEDIYYSPSGDDDTTYICIKGALWYQMNHKNKKPKASITNGPNTVLTLSPIENVIDGLSAVEILGGRTNVKCVLSIGNKYWNGSNWTTDASSTFKPTFCNNPGSNKVEPTTAFEWLGIDSNQDYRSKIGEECWAIPITANDHLYGKLHFEMYSPEVPDPGKGVDWAKGHPVVFMKDFNIGIKFVDQTVWYMDTDNENNDDIVFTNKVAEDYVAEDINTELRLTTFMNRDGMQSTISKSHVMYTTPYNNDLLYYTPNPAPEEIIVTNYYNHYSTPKLVYETTIVGYRSPDIRYFVNAIAGRPFIVDSYEWNIATRENTIKFIEQ